ncbi:MAG TPA: amidohydrolase family protein, partial [Vicinamibacterales bacterium]|nr:amidohydrolase family protein [Vicinamibacterales bacterium]
VIPGTGMPAYGPADILSEDGVIARIGDAVAGKWPAADATIDATGKYVMPGIVNTHMHWHEERVGPIPIQYERHLYLAAGVTTAREVGGVFDKTKQWRAESAAHTIVAPRIVLYPMLTDLLAPGEAAPVTPAEWRAFVRRAKERGADGIKFIGPMDQDQTAAALDEARKVGLPTTVHVAVGEATARDFVDGGVNCIEHFYGVPDAAFDAPQDFPPDMNLWNEIHRFGRAGELYTQGSLNQAKLSTLLDDMVAKGVAWSPTFSTYEATRDLVKAQNLPWYKDYLHPSLAAYYKPSMTRHGTFWIGWTASQEVAWKKNYEVWMATVLAFARKGGIVTTGDDAGFLYGSLYGFGISRELELQQEAGFSPLEVLKHATLNGAKVLGLDDRLGRVRAGFVSDLLVINGNPLENLRVMNPYGTDLMAYEGKIVSNYSGFVKPEDPKATSVHGGGIEWTIKDGIPYHGPTLMKEVKDMVATGRAAGTK